MISNSSTGGEQNNFPHYNQNHRKGIIFKYFRSADEHYEIDLSNIASIHSSFKYGAKTVITSGGFYSTRYSKEDLGLPNGDYS